MGVATSLKIISIYLDFRYIEIYIGAMKHRHRHARPDAFSGHRHHCHHHEGGPRRHRHGPRGGGGRLFDYGELRLLLLKTIAEQPSHGYELIKAIEERSGGSYAPSPGVIYPTLSWLDDMGYAVVEMQEGGRKLYRVTPEGEAFLQANAAAAEEISARLGSADAEPVPAPVLRAMKNLKLAMRMRMRRGNIDRETAEGIAAALDAAAQAVEKS
ncbi:PadR family transcriptional regulator [Nitratireductor indicus C115]|uniref:PadR family transcriptional regulator n=2 Tax=Nitratireductor indicus TaxID=721133 RepID=K2NXD0_9HYPH|nr:PadR family transcriptional regulator [Nitratireductor indicus C115]SFQ57177.1 Transcriptional regulator PadR-like family protein [Nitratireductor indicus]